MLIIGSTALKYHFPEFKRDPKDIDIVGKENILITNEISNEYGGKKVEFLENPIILKHQSNGYLHPNLLLSLKISHLFWDINWFKHMFDVQFLLGKGCEWDPYLVKELKEYWLEVHPKIRRSNLNSTKEDFFTNNVNENVDQHDYLHTLINPIPMYTRLLKDGSEVELDPYKFDQLTYEEKCDVVFEETAVMAYERYTDKTHYRDAFKFQLKDNIIKHFPKYIAMFAIQNYPKLEKPKYNYREKIKNNLNKKNEMDLDKLNLLLKDLPNIDNINGVSKISSDVPSNYYEEKYQGGEASKIEIFDIGEESVFLKIITNTDSYGGNEHVVSIQFVKPVKKEVIVYE